MSTYSGPQGKGASRLHREIKRTEAVERAVDVARIAHEQNIEIAEARRISKASRILAQLVAAQVTR